MRHANEFDIIKYNAGVFFWETDLVVEECRVNIFINGQPYVSVMATPALLDDLALGYLFSEGIINDRAEVSEINVDGYDIHVHIVKQISNLPIRARSSGFGLGSVLLKDLSLLKQNTDLVNPPRLSAQNLIKLMGEFNNISELFWKTGAVHSAWLLVDEHRFFAEDVGRHNALDKVVGQYLASDCQPAQPGLVLSTGRLSAEMVLKTARAGMGALMSRGAASKLAVDMAEKLNIILIGFLRGDQFKVFNGGTFIYESESAGENNG